jgi:ATP-binding cassette subfamily F protein uup
MNLISIENISKSYSEKILLDKISLGINEGDKIGIIGINGTGKSTLLKVIAGVENIDEGKIIKGNKVTIEYLSQNPNFNPEDTVLEQVFRGNSPVMKLLRKYEYTLEKLNNNPCDEKLQKQLIALSSNMDAVNAWEFENQAKTILTRLGISNFDAAVGTLSGGQRKRIALASALINPCDLLILDEPTNHMDNETIAWLEQYLNSRKGSLIMITHDRYFLDRVVNRMIELDKGTLYSYSGNYSVFLEKKLEREEMERATEKKRQNLLRKELAWIRRGAKARSTKQKARIDRFENLQSQNSDISSEKMDISTAHTRLGKKVIELTDIHKSYGDKNLINDFSYIISRDDRIGIIGPNGIGKSTLMNIITGKTKANSGIVDIGETVKIGYFSQENYRMEENLRVIEYIKEAAEFILTAEGTRISASKMLENFLFEPSAQWTPISKLSGGEKRRLFLLRVLMTAPNVLLLDEPTNDLDIETLTILENYIDDFNGAVITVSHDRYFLDRIANRIFSFEGNGVILEHTGNYSDYCDFKNTLSVKACENNNENRNSIDKKKTNLSSEKPKTEQKLKFSYKEQREYEEIDTIIENLESEINEIDKKIKSSSSDFQRLQELLNTKEELENKLEEKMERWEYLNELAEKIEQAK